MNNINKQTNWDNICTMFIPYRAFSNQQGHSAIEK